MRFKPFLPLCVSAALLVAGCGKEEQEEIGLAEVPKENKVDASEELKYIYPLTGIATNDETDQRAVAAMVNNHPKARPQSGISQADIVYELLAEGDVTRFLAIYQSEKPDRIGPIRSARDYYIRLAEGLDSIYVCHGYSPEAKEMLKEGFVDSLNGLAYDGTLFERDKSRKAPHNSYITYENIMEGAGENGFEVTGAPDSLPFLTEEEARSIAGEEVAQATVKYGSSSFDATYEYDLDEGKYIRSVDGEQTIDAETDREVLLDNVIVMEAPHAVIDQEGRRSIDLTGNGEAYLLQKGKLVEIQWKNIDNVLRFEKDGEPVKFVPGKTWVNIVPDNPGLGSAVDF